MASIRARADNGLLFFDFRVGDQRFREQTKLRDSPANRKLTGKVLVRLEEQIALGTFNYSEFFPGSKNAAKLEQAKPTANVTLISQAVSTMDQSAKATPLFKEFAETWYAEKSVEWRASHKKTIREILDNRLNPRFGEMMVGNITKADILSFRADLAKAPARNKTNLLSNPRINKILNPLRQILCEAADRFDFRMPFQNIKQLRVKRTDVEPFSLDEVKKIIDTVRLDFKQYMTVSAAAGPLFPTSHDPARAIRPPTDLPACTTGSCQKLAPALRRLQCL